jgi:cell division inhibitor SepF
MSLWKRTMDYLGLGPDDAYDDYDGYDEPDPSRQTRAPRDSDARHQRGYDEPDLAVRTVSARPSFPSKDFDASPSRRGASGGSGGSGNGGPGGGHGAGRQDDSGVQIRPSQSSQSGLRSVSGGSMEPSTVRPRRFDQAQEVADKFKDGQPVIMNLEGTERDVARRLIDFASGICYALDGAMEKVATGVYLLKPISSRQPRHDDHPE